MIEIRIKKVYGTNCETYVNLEQDEKGGVVRYSEDQYFTRNSVAHRCNYKTITAVEANKIFKELKKYADPYCRHSKDELLEKM